MPTYLAFMAEVFCDPGLLERWRKNAWDRLAYIARYGHVPPSESAHWEMSDLREFHRAVGDIVAEESRVPGR